MRLPADSAAGNVLPGSARPFWRDILVIVNYATRRYESVPFVRELYACMPHIAFYGQTAVESDERVAPVDDRVREIEQHDSWTCQAVMLDAMRRCPDAAGYLMFTDDAPVFPWNLERCDKARIWYHGVDRQGRMLGFQPERGFCAIVDAHCPSGCKWHWKNPEHGVGRYVEAWRLLPAPAQARLQATCGVKVPVAADVCECFYVPGRLREPWMAVADALVHARVCMEMAIPTSLLAVEDESAFERLRGICLWGADYTQWRRFCRTDTDWLHPVKLSNPANRRDLWRLFRQHGFVGSASPWSAH